ncbi:MAG: hypothetical protein KDA78_10020 [Planctomycetaceae bacterium]|nr:hypothetical protein [Planctomycetaceae bacterium]
MSEQTHDEQRSYYLVWSILGLLGLYVGFFALILLDELVFRTFYFSKFVPLGSEGEELLRTIYTPMLYLIELIT